MRRITFLLFVLVLVSLCGAASGLRPLTAQATSNWTLDGVLAMLDKSAQDFHTLTADIEHIKYTAVVKDSSAETGQILVRRDDKMRIDFQKPDPRTILRNGDSLFVFTPKINRVEEYNIGKHRSFVDQYLALGFGTKGETLKKNYVLTLIGEEDFDNRKTVVLELTPKSDQARSQIARIRMWIDEASWLPVQQKFFETGSDDYFLSHYTHVMKNLKISDARFKPDWPRNVKVEKPRG
ncbi:MAG TPA: outer membrane lipoprotein-sorting protein [Candidatus Elarobacter sp.]|nr:outer membrane lipoprotein-sorting protein [Candidatus Elarobacter sp.]